LRAIVVAHYASEHGIVSDKISAIGFGNKHIVENYAQETGSEEPLNRIEIIIKKSDASPTEDFGLVVS